MRNKKIAALLLTMALCAGMALPQAVVPFGTETALAAEPDSGTDDTAGEENYNAAHQDQNYPDSDILWQAYCGDESTLTEALRKASTDQTRPTYIWITGDITMESLTASTCAEVPANTYVSLQSVPGTERVYTISGNAVASTQVDENNAVLKGMGKELSLSDIVIDGAGNRRCISWGSSDGTLNLRSGTVIRNGGCAVNGNMKAMKGLGIYTSYTSAVSVNMYDGAEITQCNFTSDIKANVVEGKAIFVDGRNSVFHMYGGKIYENNDTYKTAKYAVGTSALKLKGAIGTVYCVGKFEMEGGEISDNHSIGGAAICLDGIPDSIIRKNAKISGNILNTEEADGEGLTSTKVNTVYWHKRDAGGIYMNSSGTLTIDDEAEIKGNVVKGKYKYASAHMLCGGGIFINRGTVILKGGTISDNHAEISLDKETDTKLQGAGNGGGIYVKEGKLAVNGGSITKNSASVANKENTESGNGGGIYVAVNGSVAAGTGASLELTGGNISNNDAVLGKDIYAADYLKYYAKETATACTDVMGSPSIVLKEGAIQIGNIYLPAEKATDSATGKAELTVAGSLSGSNIGVQTEKSDTGTVIANAANGYEGLAGDVSAFSYTGADSDSRKIEFSGGKLVLAEKAAEVKDISTATVEELQPVTYNGSAFRPEPAVTLDGVPLTAGTDFDYSYRQNTEAGEATVVITGKSPYEGTIEKKFTINALPISDESVEKKEIPDCIYNGEAWELEPELSLNGTKLEKDKDYEVSWTDNTEIGDAVVTVRGKGNFTGEQNLTFKINPADQSAVIHTGAELKEKIEALTDTSAEQPAVFTLAKNITVEGNINLPKGQYAEIKGNHKTIGAAAENFAVADEEGNAAATGMFIVNDGSSLKLTDYLTLDGDAKERLVYVCAGGTFDAGKNVTMTGGRATDKTDVLTVYGGQCIYNLGTAVFDGTIRDNETKENSYGAIYNDSYFTLGTDSKLQNITVKSFAAFYNDVNGKATMEGGEISGTSCFREVFNVDDRTAKAIVNRGTFVMKDGEIKDNLGECPTITNCGVFLMESGSVQGNQNNFHTVGGNGNGTIYQRRFDINDPAAAAPEFRMTGGAIAGNEAMLHGGGVYLSAGDFIMDGEDAVIRDNVVTSKGNEDNINSNGENGGGVCVAGGTFELKNGSIQGNQAYLKTENGTQKQAYNGGSWYYNSNGTPTEVSGQSLPSTRVKKYGLGAGIYVGSGTLKLSGGNVSGNVSAPLNKDAKQSAFPAASGIYVADGNVEMSGAPVVSDVIYLQQGKNITITDKLTGASAYTVYQTENDLKLKEDITGTVGKAVASYKEESGAYQATDGDLFKLYAYDEKYDYAADKTLTHYTAFEDGIYVNRPVMDVKDLAYQFTNADGEQDGTPYYRFNGRARVARNVTVTATAAYKDDDGKELATVSGITSGKGLSFAIQENEGNAGRYTVTVTPNPDDAEGYHYNGTFALSFDIAPFDLSQPVYKKDDDGNILYYDEEGNLTDAEHGQPQEDSNYLRDYKFGAITYAADDPEDKAFEPETTVEVRLGSNRETTLEKGKDYEVTFSNNTSGSNGNVIATIEGKGNYAGVLAKDVDTGVKVKAVQTVTAASDAISGEAGGRSAALGASSSDANAKLSYESSDTSVATVDARGSVRFVGEGTATITVTASETEDSRPAMKEVTVQVEAGSGQSGFMFTDVTNPDDFWYAPIYWAAGQDITTGWVEKDGTSTFRPWNQCNRAAIVTFLWRYAGSPDPKEMATFSDMTDSEDFNKAISWAQEQGITTGWDDNTFRPWNYCNRAAIMAFFYRYAGSPDVEAENTFADPTGNEEFDRAIAWGVSQGITTGWEEDNTFRPWNTCNRMSTVVFLYRLDSLQ